MVGHGRRTAEVTAPLLALDIGGTRLKAVRLDSDGTFAARVEGPTLAHEGALAVLARLGALVRPLFAPDCPPAAIGVASAGQVDPGTGRVVDATPNLPGFSGLDLGPAIRGWFHPTPWVAVENDVNAAAWAELAATPDLDPLLVLALGTGVGGAYAVRGQVVSGAHHFAGEVGHLLAYPGGRACNCGQAGCWEQYVSGPGLTATARAFRPETATAAEVFQAHRRGEAWAEAALDRFAHDLALGLTTLTNIFDPAAVILTGGLAETAPHWQAGLDRYLRRLCRKPCPCRVSRFGGDAPLLGAAALARRALTAQ